MEVLTSKVGTIGAAALNVNAEGRPARRAARLAH